MHFIPYCSMRSSPEAEALGMDEYDMGEFAYDYVRLLFFPHYHQHKLMLYTGRH